MRIAVVGGTGTLGRLVVAELEQRGHDVRVLSRHAQDTPVDLTTGDGLAEGLSGCEVVVDASNGTKSAVLVEGTRRLLETEARAGVRHHVAVSIVGCAGVPAGYFQLKAEQERVVMSGPVPWTLVRATQFHELVAGVLTAAARFRITPLVRAPIQTVAAAEVAEVVADAAENPARRASIQMTGPRTDDLAELARTYRRSVGLRTVPVRLAPPGRLGAVLRGGGLTMDAPDLRGRETFDQWLTDGGSEPAP
jgi:uncharacterized protein YbjT (DUF2867 family)